MKYFLFFLMGSLLIISGMTGCSENASGPEETPGLAAQGPNPPNTTNNPNEVPDDLSGTNLAPPPSPPGH